MSATTVISAVAGLVIAVGVVLYLAAARDTPPASETSQAAIVEYVIDGDTFNATNAAGEDLGRVRVLGIDTPEKSRNGEPAQCYAD